MKRIVLYADKRSLNDATSYYIDIIKKAVLKLGYTFYITDSINDIKFNDVIFTITINYYIKGLLLKPFCKTIFWSQGIAPEELMLRDNNVLKYYIKNIMEFISIRHFGLKFFISESMLNHYKNKYRFNGENYIIMPCYNLSYGEKEVLSTIIRYQTPSFVYAGSLSVWQNFDKTIKIYKYIENIIPEATLTILTEEKAKAKKIIEEYDIKNAEVKYVSLENLSQELLKYKYGFLLREDITVNNVATPTKMNSYLASGVIPIYTDALHDYVKHIILNDFDLKMKANLSIEDIAKHLVNFENSVKDFTNLNLQIKDIFNDYYNNDKYIKQITKKLTNYL